MDIQTATAVPQAPQNNAIMAAPHINGFVLAVAGAIHQNDAAAAAGVVAANAALVDVRHELRLRSLRRVIFDDEDEAAAAMANLVPSVAPQPRVGARPRGLRRRDFVLRRDRREKRDLVLRKETRTRSGRISKREVSYREILKHYTRGKYHGWKDTPRGHLDREHRDDREY